VLTSQERLSNDVSFFFLLAFFLLLLAVVLAHLLKSIIAEVEPVLEEITIILILLDNTHQFLDIQHPRTLLLCVTQTGRMVKVEKKNPHC